MRRFTALFTACLLWAGICAPTTGCSQSEVAALVNTLGTASANIAALENDPTLSAQLKADTAAAVSAVTNWQKGSPAQVAIEALNILASDLSLIPKLSPQTAELITLAIGTVDSLLALIPAPAVTAHVARPHAAVQLQNPPKTAAEFKKQWNTIVGQNAALKVAKI